MEETFREKTGENSEKLPESRKFFEALRTYKDQKHCSFDDLAGKIYREYIEAYNNEEEEEKHIKNFSQNLKKAMGSKRGTQDKILIHKDLSDNKNISIRKICEILKIEIPTEEKFISKNEYNAEAYLTFNKPIINQITPNWEKFEEKALREVEYYADRKYKEALTTLGHYYFYRGKNGIRNAKKAIDFYQQAAEKNDEIALYQLGLIYEYGDSDANISPDENKSFSYYSKLADSELEVALNKLAYCYYQGKGTIKDFNKFFQYSEKASNTGNIESQLNVAYAYLKGIGVNKDIKKAVEQYEELAKNDNPYMAFIHIMLSNFYKNEESIRNLEKSKAYLILYFEKQLELVKSLDNNSMHIFESLHQIYSLTPDKFIMLEEKSYYDYINNPIRPSILEAFFS